MQMKKTISTLLILIMASFTLSSPGQADTPVAEQFVSPFQPGEGYFGYRSIPDFTLHFTSPVLMGMETTGDTANAVRSCNSLTDSKCANSNFWTFSTALDACTSVNSNNCIDAVTAVDASGKSLEVNLDQTFPGIRPQDYVGDNSQNLPNGGKVHFYSIPGAPHAGGNLYVPIVLVDGNKEGSANSGTFKPGQIRIGFYAVTVINGKYDVKMRQTDVSRYNSRYMVTTMGGEEKCIINDETSCALPQAIPLNIKFGMRIRTSFAAPGWFHGRFSDPEIKISTDASKNTILDVAAHAVVTPIFALWKKKTDLPQSLLDFYKKQPFPLGGTGSGAGDAVKQSGDPMSWSLMFDPVGYSQNDMDQFLQWLPVFGDKSTVEPTYWSMYADNGDINSNRCSPGSDVLTGVVSTNASQYISGPPQWDSNSQTLEYKVAAAHFTSTGEVFKGSYDLAIQSDYARCLYGFTKAPIKATISIISNSGDSAIVTTTVRESNNFLYLAAKGFTFSNPTIQVKLSQEAPAPVVTPTPAATPSVTSTPEPTASTAPTTQPTGPTPKPTVVAKKTTITCIKGKTLKTVTAVKPICPTGYKKK